MLIIYDLTFEIDVKIIFNEVLAKLLEGRHAGMPLQNLFL
jgi:uncharacterized membrane-anchored protein